jgi:uncharacterized protein YneF (UPF0154 family)
MVMSLIVCIVLFAIVSALIGAMAGYYTDNALMKFLLEDKSTIEIKVVESKDGKKNVVYLNGREMKC